MVYCMQGKAEIDYYIRILVESKNTQYLIFTRLFNFKSNNERFHQSFTIKYIELNSQQLVVHVWFLLISSSLNCIVKAMENRH